MLQADTQAKGALFTVPTGSRKDNGPVMTGNFEVRTDRVGIAAFSKVSTETGKDYLNLKVGNKAGPTFYGKLFRNDSKKHEKSPDFTGYVNLGTGDDTVQLRVAGWEETSREKKMPYISLELSPAHRKSNTSTGSDGDGDALPL